jgi:hypothetical protein
MYIWRVVATHPVTGRQFASDWYDNETEADAVRIQMIADPSFDGYSFIIERKLASAL